MSPFTHTPSAIAAFAHQTPHALAVVEQEARITYADLAGAIIGCMGLLSSHGIGPSKLVAVETQRKRCHTLVLLLALEALGAASLVIVPAEAGRGDAVLSRCHALLLTQPIQRPLETNAIIIPPQAINDFAKALFPTDLTPLTQAHDPASLVRLSRTSGTTARPKTIPISRKALQRIIDNRSARVPADIRRSMRFLAIYDFGVRACYTRILGALQFGGTVVFAPSGQASKLLALGAVNCGVFVVGHAEQIAAQGKLPEPEPGPWIEIIGAVARPALLQLLQANLRARIDTTYSSNETNVISYTDAENVGTLAPGAAIRIVDDAGLDVPLRKTGLILARTDTMTDGYYDDPELTRTAFVDGWFRTNDVGYQPDPGKLVVLGRADDVLNVGGIKLVPGPLEDRIRQCPGVTDAALLGVPGARGVVRLVVAAEVAGGMPPATLHADIAAIVSSYASRFDLLPLPWFPRTETGKVRRREIEALASARLPAA